MDQEAHGASRTRRIGWEILHRDSVLLSRRLAMSGPFHGIIAVARGGLVPAAVVAQELEIRLVETVCIVSYDDRVRREGEGLVLKAVAGSGAGWLVVDDLVDSGATFRQLRRMLPLAHYASVYAKPQGAAAVDTMVMAVEQEVWLVFPWEETPHAGG